MHALVARATQAVQIIERAREATAEARCVFTQGDEQPVRQRVAPAREVRSEQREIDEGRRGRVRLQPRHSPTFPPRASRERRDEVGRGAFARSRSRDFPYRAFAEPIGQHAEREQMCKAISTKTERLRYRANALDLAAREFLKKVSAADGDRAARMAAAVA